MKHINYNDDDSATAAAEVAGETRGQQQMID